MKYLDRENADKIDFIREILSQSGFLKIKNIARLQSGSRSAAYYADDYVIRFPKSEIIWRTMKREKNIIDMIYPYLVPALVNKIHKIDLIESEYPFSVSNRINGKICDGRPKSEYAARYQDLTLIQQENLARDLAVFFNQMHQIDYKKLDIPEPTETIDLWDVTLKNNFDFKKVRETLLSYKIDLNDYEIQSKNTVISLCHNDLSGSNILLNPEKENILSGIIDFGNTIVMPKYQDFFPLYKINRKLASDTLSEYNKITASPIEQKQIDFLALSYIGFGLLQNKEVLSPYFMKLLKPFL